MKYLFTLAIFLQLGFSAQSQVELPVRCEVLIVDKIDKRIYAVRLDNHYVFSFPTGDDIKKFSIADIIGVRFENKKVTSAKDETISVSEFRQNRTGADQFSSKYWDQHPANVNRTKPLPLQTRIVNKPGNLSNRSSVPFPPGRPEIEGSSATLLMACFASDCKTGAEFNITGINPVNIQHKVYACNNLVFADPADPSLPIPLIFPIVRQWMDSSFNPEIDAPVKAGYDLQDQKAMRPNTEQWSRSAAKGIPKGKGRLNLNFPAGVDWSIDIYKGNKFIINRSIETYKLKYYDLLPGLYNFKVNTVLVENVEIKEGHTTTLLTGVLDINSNDWELRDESAKKFLTSGNRSKRMALPAGSYQLVEGRKGRLVQVIPADPVKPEVLTDDQYQYIISPVTDTALASTGRLNFALASTNFGTLGYVIEFQAHIFDEAGNMVKSCGSVQPCVHQIYLPEGKYTIKIAWSSDAGIIDHGSQISIPGVWVKKGHETRIKLGYLQNKTSGDFELLNGSKAVMYWQYISQGAWKRPLPVGKYVVRIPGIGEFPIQMEDQKTVSIDPLKTTSSQRNEQRAFRISPIASKTLKRGMGRLNCEFPLADSIAFRLSIPNANGGTRTINLDTVKFIDLLPGKYELKLGNMTIPFQIEKEMETKIIHGYLKMPFNKMVVDVARGGYAHFLNPSKIIPVRPGFYYVYDVEGHPGRQLLIKVSEGEVVDYIQFILVD